MQDIWVPLSLIILFLLLHILRPHLKQLRPIEGLAWFPLVSLLIALILIPAYGFRPEVLPLLLYSGVLAGISFRKYRRGDEKMPYYRGLVFLILPLVILIFCSWTALHFRPALEGSLSSQGVHTLRLEAGRDYHLRLYTDEDDPRPSRRPLLLLLPPAYGSPLVTDQLSMELRDRGFTVLSYTREPYGQSPRAWMHRQRAFRQGSQQPRANMRGRALEELRLGELSFLLPWLRSNPWFTQGPLFDQASRDEIFLAGFDAGASALILLESAEVPGIRIRGLVAVESYLWSLYREEAPPPLPTRTEEGWLSSLREGIGRVGLRMRRPTLAPREELPPLGLPVLFLVSDRVRENPDAPGPYQALLALNAAEGGILISPEGAGPFDFSDVPLRYPLISRLFPGQGSPTRELGPVLSAEIIAAFAASTLGRPSLNN